MKEQTIKAITFAFDLFISFYAMVNETIGYFTLQILYFLQIEGLWQPCGKPIQWCNFSNSICSLCLYVTSYIYR